MTVGELESPSARGKKRILRILFRSGTVTVWGIHECTATHLIKPSEMSLTLSFSLSLPTGASQSLPLITMPIEEPARFSLKGAKWLLFLAGCIYGDFDGHLSLSSAGDAIDYDAPLHATTYHFVSDSEAFRVAFPARSLLTRFSLYRTAPIPRPQADGCQNVR